MVNALSISDAEMEKAADDSTEESAGIGTVTGLAATGSVQMNCCIAWGAIVVVDDAAQYLSMCYQAAAG